MNTPAHLILGAAVFGKPGKRFMTASAVLGSLAPDISLYVMAGWSLIVAGIEPNIVFGRLYFSDLWQGVFAVDNSFVFWGMLLTLALWCKRPLVATFASAGLLHLGFDLALHNEDARMMFWPVSNWVFRSPISYWDPRHFGAIIGPIELAGVLVLSLWLWRRYKVAWSRGLIGLGVAAELMTSGIFGMLFSH